MGQVRHLACSPRRLRPGVRVRAPEDDLGDTLTKLGTNDVQGRQASLVFDGVVKQRGDGLVLVAAGLDDQGRDAQQVREVGDIGAFADLLAVQARRKQERGIESI